MKSKALIPKFFKLKYQLLKRYFNDRGIVFATKRPEVIPFPYAISTLQEIKQGPFFENKIHNLKTGSKALSSVTILPYQVFSFWEIVGSPNAKKGFKKGRNIVKGKVSEEIGGGLCQLSSIVYITALKANLEILERYNHSVDIYKEADRFTPLGADATVVYGYKDLRFRNNFNFPIQFNFMFTDNHQLICYLESLEKIEEKKLDFIRHYKENSIEVATHLNSTFHCTSVYKIMELN